MMKVLYRLLAVAAIAASITALVGCEESDEEDVTGSENSDSLTTVKQIRLDEGDNGDDVGMNVGDRLEVVLKQVGEISGYRWEIESYDKSVLKEGHHESVSDNPPVEDEDGIVMETTGGGYTAYLRFTAITAGRTVLNLVSEPPATNYPIGGTFEVTINVTE